MSRILIAACVLPMAAVTPVLALGERVAPGEDEICVRGRFSDAGVECQAFAGEDGRLYTLMPRQVGRDPGDTACLCGRPAQVSICMQGTTLSEVRLASPEHCP